MSRNLNNSAPSQLALQDKLFHISKDLCEEEIHGLKFLLHDLLPKTQLTPDARSLFRCLEERVLIQESNPQLLVQCLVLIGREDLAGKNFPNHDKRTQTDKLSNYRLKLFEVATGLKLKEKDHLLELYPAIPKSKVEQMRTPHDLLSYLEERQIITQQDTTSLQTALKHTGREDMANVLLRYHGGVPSGDSNTNAQPCSSMSSTSGNAGTNTTDQPSVHSSMSFGGESTDQLTEGKMTAATAKLLVTAAESVGRIGDIGTGFRVGSKYIMTASHVIKRALGFLELTPVTFEQIQNQLEKQGLDIHFTFGGDLKPVPLRTIVLYSDRSEQIDDNNLDVTIAELDSDYELPDPLLNFFDNLGTNTQKKVYFLGHDGGCEGPELGFSWTLVDGPKLQMIASELDRRELLGQSDKAFFYKVGKDPIRVQLQGPFRGGGSGSPGVVVGDGRVKVFTILTHGHYYQPNIPDELQIQEGIRMWCLKEILKSNVVLCEDIFRGWDTQRNDDSQMDVQ